MCASGLEPCQRHWNPPIGSVSSNSPGLLPVFSTTLVMTADTLFRFFILRFAFSRRAVKFRTCSARWPFFRRRRILKFQPFRPDGSEVPGFGSSAPLRSSAMTMCCSLVG